MKKLFYISIAIIAGATVFACQRVIEDESHDVLPVNDNVRMIEVTCTLPAQSSDSKVTLTNDGEYGKTAWVNGDEVLFHGEYMGEKDDKTYSYVASAHDVSADGKTAHFTIPDLDGKYAPDPANSYLSSIFALYPADLVYDYAPKAHWYYASGFKETNHLLLAGYNLHRDDDPYTFNFINLTGALSFKVSGEFDAYSIEGNNGETIGWDRYTVTAAQCTSWQEHRTCYKGSTGPGGTSGAHTSILVEPAGSTWCNGSTINTVFFPGTGSESDNDPHHAAVRFTKGFTIKFYKDGDFVKQAVTKTDVTIRIGDLLDLGLIPSDKVKTPPAHEAAAWTSGILDSEALSYGESANCYYVYHKDVEGYSGNAGKAFKFKAVKGNTSTVIDKIASVSVLWETYNNSSAVTAGTVIADVDFDDTYIYFKMPDAENMHAGNAVIAAKNAMGKILWSWHIWVPSSKITNNQYGLSGQKWMDRNLGALVVAEASESSAVNPLSIGFFYAWGRKDPFPGATAAGGSTYITTTGSFNMNGAQMSLEQSYASPTTFVSTGSDETQNWATDDPHTGFWGSSKTVNDPCPPGYIVPKYVEGESLWRASSVTGFSLNNTYKWFKAGSGSFIVFPIVGFLDGCQATAYIRTDRSNMWSSTANNAKTSKCLRVNTDGTAKIEDERQARGFAVRCVVDE